MACNFSTNIIGSTTLIVGGGPAGLGVAIEAACQGEEVTVLEKRAEYSRKQSLFLTGESLEQLKRWEVDLPDLHVASVGPEEKIGFVAIHHLEKQMAVRAKELGVKIEQACFIDITNRAVLVEKEGKEIEMPYEILVGADGAHSKIREKLGIGVTAEHKMYGTAAIIPWTGPPRDMDISSGIHTKSGYARRIATPAISIVFMQSNERLSHEEMVLALRECGWQEEASYIEENRDFEVDYDIEVILQQADCFSDLERRALLVGDAAATASFFEGKGVNTVIKCAAIAGNWLKQLKAGDNAGPSDEKDLTVFEVFSDQK